MLQWSHPCGGDITSGHRAGTTEGRAPSASRCRAGATTGHEPSIAPGAVPVPPWGTDPPRPQGRDPVQPHGTDPPWPWESQCRFRARTLPRLRHHPGTASATPEAAKRSRRVLGAGRDETKGAGLVRARPLGCSWGRKGRGLVRRARGSTEAGPARSCPAGG